MSDVVETGSVPRLHRKYGAYVAPDTYEQNAEAIDHAETHNRRRVLENASGQGARF